MMVESADFYEKDGNPVVAQSFCVVADLLGLKARVTRCEGEEELNDLCTLLADLLAEATSLFKEEWSDTSSWRPWAHRVFSDTLLLGYPIVSRNDAGEPELGGSLDFVQWFQFRMALGGFFVCGGMSIGYLHLSSEHCFGPALIEAHEIEQRPPNL
ncbi:MAG: hypothetical protein IID35_11520, partial [Planctomycetes bacterium]|nr:hypothetical protein [Planctomycetota bacterium]